MALIDRLTSAIADAMRARDVTRLSALRMAKAALMNAAVARGRDLAEPEAQQVIAGLIKQRRDSIEQYRNAGRTDLSDRETAEIAVLEPYLPPPVDAAHLEAAVESAIAQTGATGPKDLGRVMKAAMAALAGTPADGKMVNELARRKLGA